MGFKLGPGTHRCPFSKWVWAAESKRAGFILSKWHHVCVFISIVRCTRRLSRTSVFGHQGGSWVQKCHQWQRKAVTSHCLLSWDVQTLVYAYAKNASERMCRIGKIVAFGKGMVVGGQVRRDIHFSLKPTGVWTLTLFSSSKNKKTHGSLSLWLLGQLAGGNPSRKMAKNCLLCAN